MIRLDTTTRSIQALLGGAVTTNQLNITACWSDKTSTNYAGSTTVTNSNNTTAVTVVAAPASSTVRDIDAIEVYNADTVAATVTVRFNDNGTLYTLVHTTLQTSETLIWTHAAGWKTVDANGNTKNSIGGILPVASGGTGDGTLTAHGVMVGEGTSAVVVTAAGTSGQILTGQGATSDPAFETMSGDATYANTGAFTLATVNSNVGTFGSAALHSSVTVNAKGLVTAASSITPALTAGTIDGTTIGGTTPAAGTFTKLAANNNEALTYGNAASQTIPNNSATTLTSWTKITDRLNANFNASTGVYTAPVAGYYLISAQIYTSSITPTAISEQVSIYILLNGSVDSLNTFFTESTSANFFSVNITRLYHLNVSDTISIQAFQNCGASTTLQAHTSLNWLSISQIP